MFASFATFIRRLPWWGQLPLWPLYGIGRFGVWFAEMLGNLVINSTGNFFGWTVKGSFTVILGKVAGVLLAVGIILMALGAETLGVGFMSLAFVPIMLMGLLMMAKSALPSKKEKKDKSH
jgi:hypothetical protein